MYIYSVNLHIAFSANRSINVAYVPLSVDQSTTLQTFDSMYIECIYVYHVKAVDDEQIKEYRVSKPCTVLLFLLLFFTIFF